MRVQRTLQGADFAAVLSESAMLVGVGVVILVLALLKGRFKRRAEIAVNWRSGACLRDNPVYHRAWSDARALGPAANTASG